MEANFCMNCSAALEDRDMDGTIRRACPECSFVHWGSYSIGVGALIVKEKAFLLVRRAQNPGMGYWTNPGGYIEQLEGIEETIRREVREEAGVDAVVRRIIALRDQPRTIHNVYIAFEMEYVGGEPVPDGVEVDAAGFFTLEEIESMNVAPFTRWLLDAAANAGANGLHADEAPVVPLAGYGLFRA
ncbi:MULTISPECIES: NUDIX domain-containing protein [Paenibacillus]|uniref:NUDIX domain-containing protein n=1 Tax=Paenibacillus TaxID=44249 RepID=UPI0022B90423|nr:NUDIX domain-containing protein [Paenibacillus caseinilyticus]MCZ8521239.1 NUDIX domain-containing protein [Paenibacillus caseinilyticus]